MKKNALRIACAMFAATLVFSLAACSATDAADANRTGVLTAAANTSAHVHTYSDEWQYDSNNHWHASTCGHDGIVSGLAAHVFDEEGVCECGYTRPDATHVHEFATEWSNDAKNHWHAAICGHDGIVSGLAPHVFNDEGVCECGFIRPDPAHTHTFEEKWTYDANNHWHASACGHDIVTGLAAHSFDADGVCECGYVQPATEHVHTYSESWSYDESGHWHVSTCGHDVTSDYEEHTYSNGVCVICGYEPPAAELPDSVSAAGGYSESLYAEWETNTVTGVSAYYSAAGENDWTAVDGALLRMLDEDTARVDVVGLRSGLYDLKISGAEGDLTVSNITVSAYDRSGYAHFNYTSGIGAYNDDGTLKEGALVIYLTDANKNDISGYAYCNGQKIDISSYLWNGYKGIGYLLNNRQYANNTERTRYGIQALCNDFGAVAIRILDTVNAEVASDATASLIEGLTAYNSTDNGGSTGDNGRMARITNAKNLTIEGIGTAAGLYGWGVHFISNDNLHQYEGSGESFEVRNLTFEHYPEDAIGMEGTQGTSVDSTGSITAGASSATSDLISPVERCWIHHNSFLPGYCASPAESDKAEGDGSCDFKRGQYYTLSYNYFEYCHKTNLVGSADASLTYNLSIHHNYWYNCGSRMPLIRRANCHFYNNYIYGDSNDSAASLSYVTSARANCYLFSEANYFDGSKNPVQLQSGGVVKAFGNVYYACTGTNSAVEVSSRTEAVTNSCSFIYRKIDYSNFDTDPELFYYDAVNEVSDCYITDAVTARAVVINSAGANRDGEPVNTAMNYYTPENALSVGENGVTIDLTSVSKGTSTVGGVLFTNITGVSGGVIKGKGQIITFTLTTEAELRVSASASTADYQGELISSDGTVWASKFTDLTIVLPAGTYVICSGDRAKELSVSSLVFADTSASAAARIEAATTAINAIPETITADCEDAVNAAQSAYNALTAGEKAAFDSSLYEKLQNAAAELNQIKADEVIGLIAQIGTVTSQSYPAISAAQEAFDLLTGTQKNLVTNYSVLLEAQNEFAQFAVTNLENTIEDLADAASIDISDKTAIEEAAAAYLNAYELYTDLDEERAASVGAEYLAKLNDGIAELNRMYAPYLFKAALAEFEGTVTLSDGAAIGSLINAYQSFGEDQLSVITAEETAKYNEITEAYIQLASQTISLSFTAGTDNYANSQFTYSGNTRTQAGESVTVLGETYTTSLKMESSTSVSFNAPTDMTLILYFYTGCVGNKVKIDGTSYTIGTDGTVSVTLESGEHSVTKDSTNTYLFLVLLSPAN